MIGIGGCMDRWMDRYMCVLPHGAPRWLPVEISPGFSKLIPQAESPPSAASQPWARVGASPLVRQPPAAMHFFLAQGTADELADGLVFPTPTNFCNAQV